MVFHSQERYCQPVSPTLCTLNSKGWLTVWLKTEHVGWSWGSWWSFPVKDGLIWWEAGTGAGEAPGSPLPPRNPSEKRPPAPLVASRPLSPPCLLCCACLSLRPSPLLPPHLSRWAKGADFPGTTEGLLRWAFGGWEKRRRRPPQRGSVPRKPMCLIKLQVRVKSGFCLGSFIGLLYLGAASGSCSTVEREGRATSVWNNLVSPASHAQHVLDKRVLKIHCYFRATVSPRKRWS